MIYILKISEPLGNERHQAQYYLGYAEDVEKRLKQHRCGRGASITRAAVKKGLSLELVVSFPGDRGLERRLKNQKNTARIVERALKGTLRV